MDNLGERPHTVLDMESTIPDILLPEQVYAPAVSPAHERQQRFALAVIESAVRDLRSDEYRVEALAWLYGEITDGVTFEACCESLGVEEDVILRRLGQVRSRATGYRSFH